MLCSICHEQPATVHITTIVEGLEQRQDLCETCAAASQADIHAWANKMVGTTCDYCGSAATAGLAPGGGRGWCQKCADQFATIFQQVHAELPRPEDMAQYPAWKQQVMAETERRMRARGGECR